MQLQLQIPYGSGMPGWLLFRRICTSLLHPSFPYIRGMKNFGFLSLLAAAALLPFSCKQPQSFEYRDVRNLHIDSFGLGSSTLKMDLIYFNPNSFGVDLKHVDCDVYVNSNFLGKYLLDTIMHIAKKSEFALPSQMQVDMKNIFKNSLAALFNKEVLVEVKGNTRVGKAGIYFTVPFTYSARQKISLFD